MNSKLSRVISDNDMHVIMTQFLIAAENIHIAMCRFSDDHVAQEYLNHALQNALIGAGRPMNVALRPERLDYISLCTGGAGLDLGLELAIPCARGVVCMEREAVAVARLASAMEEGLLAPAPIWSDVRTFPGRPWRGLVDGLIGGIPCQPHSVAGQQLGEEDERDLWAPARRIIVQARPWFVLIENVEGMLHTGGLERVCRDLRRLRFEVEVGLFSASECGATHQRNRLFVLAVADPWRGQLSQPWRGPEGRNGLGPASPVNDVAYPDRRFQQGRRARSSEALGGRPRDQFAGPSDGLVNAAGERRREGQSEPVIRSGWDSIASPSDPMGHADDARLEGYGGHGECANQRALGPSSSVLADSNVLELRQQPPAGQLPFDERNARRSLFPPGPNDVEGWLYHLELWPEFEPAICRVADGVVGRVDQLRMLGNGVVPLQAAYAVRTLATRLARRAPGAERLVRMMGIAA
jgi:DNA (cytosine-5)-methyltransferase 1